MCWKEFVRLWQIAIVVSSFLAGLALAWYILAAPVVGATCSAPNYCSSTCPCGTTSVSCGGSVICCKPFPNPDADPHAHANENPYANTNSYENVNENSHANTNSYENANKNSKPYSHEDTYPREMWSGNISCDHW